MWEVYEAISTTLYCLLVLALATCGYWYSSGRLRSCSNHRASWLRACLSLFTIDGSIGLVFDCSVTRSPHVTHHSRGVGYSGPPPPLRVSGIAGGCRSMILKLYALVRYPDSWPATAVI
jgi:hypothetical protein